MAIGCGGLRLCLIVFFDRARMWGVYAVRMGLMGLQMRQGRSSRLVRGSEIVDYQRTSSAQQLPWVDSGVLEDWEAAV